MEKERPVAVIVANQGRRRRQGLLGEAWNAYCVPTTLRSTSDCFASLPSIFGNGCI